MTRDNFFSSLSLMKNSKSLYVLINNFFGVVADRCGSPMVRERDKHTKCLGWIKSCKFLSF